MRFSDNTENKTNENSSFVDVNDENEIDQDSNWDYIQEDITSNTDDEIQPNQLIKYGTKS